MDKIIYITITLVCFTALFLSAKNPEKEVPAFNKFSEIRVFAYENSNTTKAKGTFFLIAGSYESESTVVKTALFYAKSRTGEYVLFEMPLKDIRFKLDNRIKKPVVYFLDAPTWTCGVDFYKDKYCIGGKYYYSSSGVVIYASESMLPESIASVKF